ncbi:MAG TPA: hypothetical protein DEB15_00380 [Pusillimonas sp.]|mgnify:CR=1 FL=1|jgi:AcrR family transcriptional regulator|nr:hypothetical protein [Pusillimonas sp.]MBC42606.1 hypothetical protein [Pusillimonas sp.]HBT31379.1 hypothetical protein [Pusillimonas sp.]HCP78985.1 hypothetical protein [Pusillimonas sp.]|tara:strand:+ start:13461 stop:14000 length:540 start_codon:yes stop_codon:yes gene_type:complete
MFYTSFMGRKPSIDKTRLLAAAEQIICTRGAAALSFDAIAKAAGVSKGGVQSAFGTKEALLDALYNHLDGDYETRFRHAQENGASTVDAYIDAVLSAADSVNQRVAAISLAMTQEPESRECLRKWYAESFPGLTTGSAEARQEILRLCALEGAMMLRFMNLVELDESGWAHVLADLKKR